MLSESPEFDSLDIRIFRSMRGDYRSTTRKAWLWGQRAFGGEPRESDAYVVEVRLPNDEPRSAVLPDLPNLGRADQKSYGMELFNWLLPDGVLRQVFRLVRWSAEQYSQAK